MSLPPVCILAGGRGVRLGDRTLEAPKPLVEVAGAPFLAHQLALLRRHGAERVVICIGYLGEQIEAAIGDGSRFGLEVAYAYDGERLIGTAGAVRGALGLLGSEFLVLYGDTYLRLDYAAMVGQRRASGLPALMAVLRNEGRWDVSNAAFDGRLVRYDKAHPTPDMAWIDYGVAVLSDEALAIGDPADPDLAGLYRILGARGLLGGYPAEHRFYEIGTPEALAETDEFLRNLAD